MTTIPEDYLRDIIQKLASAHNLKNINYTQEKFESVAQNFFGVIIPVVLNGTHEEKDVRLQLVLKLAPTDERYRVSGAVTAMFAREIFVYTVILKNYQQLQQLFPINRQFIIPRSYFVQKDYCQEVIAMQDMHAEGYKIFSGGMFLDIEHIIISLESLAKLHALSFIMQIKDSDLYNGISSVCIPLTEESNKRYMDIMRDRLMKALDNFSNTHYVPLLEKLRENCGKFFNSTIDSVKNTCICHGDIWKENILYKYKDEKPISACLIDYQTSRICSPAFDTLYLIISSTDTDLRQQYYHQLLNSYYQMFDQTLRDGNIDSKAVYSRQMLEHDLGVVAPACLITANCALWLLNGLQEEGHVRSKLVLATKEEKEKAVLKYMGILQGMIDDLSSYGYLGPNQIYL